MQRTIRILVTAALTAATVLTPVGAAVAHVEIVPSSAPKGATEILAFSVLNEKEDASTTKLEIELPTNSPIASVRVKPMAGWSITIDRAKLPKPVVTDDGEVTEAVSKVTWTATDGGLGPGTQFFETFTVLAGPLPTKPNKLVFKALQTYSDGDVVRWIEASVKGAPEPEFPAPTLKLTKATTAHGH